MKAKKIVALVLALVMVLALGTSALAATGDMSNPVNGEKVTVSGEEGCAITIAAGQKVQIIAQIGTAAPFLTVLYGE